MVVMGGPSMLGRGGMRNRECAIRNPQSAIRNPQSPCRVRVGVEELHQTHAAFFYLVVEDGDQTAPGFNLLRPAAADYDVRLRVHGYLVFADSPLAADGAPQRLPVIRRQLLK